MKNYDEIDKALKAVCPVQGVSYGDPNDRTTWIIHYAEGATEEQRKAADGALAKMTLQEVQPAPDPVLARLSALEQKAGITPIGVLDIPTR